MNRHILLASGSPRRKALLENACFHVDVRIPNADETWPGGPLDAAVTALAQRKLVCAQPGDALALAADTVVFYAGEALGKPRDAAEAYATLTRLSGHEHTVATGFAISHGTRQVCRAVLTQVRFRALSKGEIEHYVASGDCFDKAGGYGIQGMGGALVDTVQGSYNNIVGLPLAEVLQALDSL